MEFLREFLHGCHFAGKPVVLPNVGCFLRLTSYSISLLYTYLPVHFFYKNQNTCVNVLYPTQYYYTPYFG